MSARIAAALVLSAGLSLPAQAQENPYSPAWAVYAVNNVCQSWGNGLGRCIPVAWIGPAPGAGGWPQPLMPPVPPQAMFLPPAMPAAPLYPPSLMAPMPPVAPPILPMWPMAQAAPAYTPPPIAPPIPAFRPPFPPAKADLPPTLEPPPLPPTIPATTPAQAAASTEPLGASTPQETLIATVEPISGPVAPMPAQSSASPILTLFSFDSADLAPAHQAQIDDWLTRIPPEARLKVTGHADRLGTMAYNQTLSRRRAEAVKRYLTSKGMRPNDIQVAARGEKEPVVTCTGGVDPATIACLAPNRRVEIVPE
ncbi:MAG: OmpA family protein [Pseudomonadota bacterium]